MGAHAILIMLLPQHSPCTFVQLVHNLRNHFVHRLVVQGFVGVLKDHSDRVALLIARQLIAFVYIEQEDVLQEATARLGDDIFQVLVGFFLVDQKRHIAAHGWELW